MSDREAWRQAVLDLIQSVVPGAEGTRLHPDQPLREQLDLDSLDWLGVLAGLEQRLAVAMPADDQTSSWTLDQVLDHIASAPHMPPLAPSLPGPHETTRHRIAGHAVTLRPMRPDDATREADFVHHLSAESRYLRFLAMLNELPPEALAYLTQVDQARHVALVATTAEPAGEVFAGVARYIVDGTGTSCEFAIVVGDAWQGSGLAGLLMRRLIATADARGLKTMEGLVLATNSRMLRLAAQLGFKRQTEAHDRTLVHVRRSL